MPSMPGAWQDAQPAGAELGITRLDGDALDRVLRKLDPAWVAALACCCSHLRRMVDASTAWRAACSDRWDRLIKAPLTSDTAGWKRLYLSGNGLRPRGPLQQTAIVRGEEVAGTALTTAAALGCELPSAAADGELLLVTGHESVKIFSLRAEGSAVLLSSAPHPLNNTFDMAHQIEILPSWGVVPMGGGRLAIGGPADELQLWQQTEAAGQFVWECVWQPPELADGCCYGDLQLHPAANRLVWFSNTPARSRLVLFDCGSLQLAGQAREQLDSYELAGFTLFPGQQALVAASHTQDACNRCVSAGTCSLCWHRSRWRPAQLCTFDPRAGAMVARNATHHRGIGPSLATAREHYLFSSHAGNPLCVWDMRNLSCCVWEAEPETRRWQGLRLGPALPLAQPARPARHNGLALDCRGDALAGCYENGMAGMWDLTACLGWQRGAHGPGAWLCEDGPEWAAAGEHFAPLGAWRGSQDAASHEAREEEDSIAWRRPLLGQGLLIGTFVEAGGHGWPDAVSCAALG